MDKNKINKIVTKFFKGYDKEFVKELSRLLSLYNHKFYINNSKRLAIFLAHVKAEVDVRHHKVIMREIMNYSIKGLMIFKIFRHHLDWAKKYGRSKYHKANQKMIANIAYANRLGNRNIASGDGFRNRGVGILQSTGAANIYPELRIIEQKTGITLFDKKGEPYSSFFDSYTGGILLGFADWYRSKMYAAKTMDASTDIINRYTKSRKKRTKLCKQAVKIINNIG